MYCRVHVHCNLEEANTACINLQTQVVDQSVVCALKAALCLQALLYTMAPVMRCCPSLSPAASRSLEGRPSLISCRRCGISALYSVLLPSAPAA